MVGIFSVPSFNSYYSIAYTYSILTYHHEILNPTRRVKKRNFSKVYTDQLNSGKPYATLKKATCLSILGFDLFKDSTRIQESFEFRNTHGDLILSDTLALHYLDLTK